LATILLNSFTIRSQRLSGFGVYSYFLALTYYTSQRLQKYHHIKTRFHIIHNNTFTQNLSWNALQIYKFTRF
jgi:hypothetical protein